MMLQFSLTLLTARYNHIRRMANDLGRLNCKKTPPPSCFVIHFVVS